MPFTRNASGVCGKDRQVLRDHARITSHLPIVECGVRTPACRVGTLRKPRRKLLEQMWRTHSYVRSCVPCRDLSRHFPNHARVSRARDVPRGTVRRSSRHLPTQAEVSPTRDVRARHPPPVLRRRTVFKGAETSSESRRCTHECVRHGLGCKVILALGFACYRLSLSLPAPSPPA